MNKNTRIRLLSATGLLLASQLAFADSGAFSVGTGFDYSSGTYGTSTTTDITSIPVYGIYQTDKWTFKLTVPYIQINGSTNVIPGLGKLSNNNPHKRGNQTQANSTTSTSAQGLGDIVAAVGYNAYYDPASTLGVDLIGKIKFGTADANQGLGTGENDYSGEVDVYQSFGKVTVFGGLGYNVLGSSQYIQLNNVFNATLGAGYKFDDSNSASLTYTTEQQVSDTGYPLRELTATVVHKINKQWNAQAYVLSGFSYGSPDWGTGASVAYAF